MTIEEKITEVINDYVSLNGTFDEMTRDQLYKLVSELYQIKNNSFLPADYCYNRTNEGIDFEKHVHLFERTEAGNYIVLGENYLYSGPVYCRKRGETEDSVYGMWMNGVYKPGDDSSDTIELRLADLLNGIKIVFKTAPVSVNREKHSVLITFQEWLFCGIAVETEVYRIYNVTEEWSDKTTYHCEKAEDGTFYYYLETIDECIGEAQRLVKFEIELASKLKGNHTSELSRVVTVDVFKNAYTHFIEQADRNAISRKAQGSKVPYGFLEKPECDGAYFKAQYGQGAPSATPYMNWWVVSVYYIPESGDIVMGIEVERYPFINKMRMKPLRNILIGNKKTKVAVFYSTTKTHVNYPVLYDNFMTVCEEVIRLGLNKNQ